MSTNINIDAPIVGDPDTVPSAALHWLAKHRHEPTREPYAIVRRGELVLSQPSLVSSLSQDHLYAFLEQVGAAALELGRFQLADPCIARLQSRFPDSVRVKCLHGMRLESTGEYSKALDFYQHELARDSTAVALSRRLVATLRALPASHPRGGVNKAIDALNRHLDTFYHDPEGWQELAEMYAELGQYQQSIFALEELQLLVPQNSFFQLKLAETLYTAGLVARSYKSYLRVLEMCKSDDAIVDGTANGPWLRALWGTKMCTSTILSNPSSHLGLGEANSTPLQSPGTEDVQLEKVKAIDQLVTRLLLERIYSPEAAVALGGEGAKGEKEGVKGENGKAVRDVVRKVLAVTV